MFMIFNWKFMVLLYMSISYYVNQCLSEFVCGAENKKLTKIFEAALNSDEYVYYSSCFRLWKNAMGYG